MTDTHKALADRLQNQFNSALIGREDAIDLGDLEEAIAALRSMPSPDGSVTLTVQKSVPEEGFECWWIMDGNQIVGNINGPQSNLRQQAIANAIGGAPLSERNNQPSPDGSDGVMGAAAKAAAKVSEWSASKQAFAKRVVGDPLGAMRLSGPSDTMYGKFTPITVASASRPSDTSPSPEPVAWRWQNKIGSKDHWTYSATKPEDHPQYVTEPLYPAPSPSPAAEREALVPQLMWSACKYRLADVERVMRETAVRAGIGVRQGNLSMVNAANEILRELAALSRPAPDSIKDGE